MQTDDRRLAARWTRREFVRGAAGMVALPICRMEWLPRRPQQFAYVASGEGSLHVFRLRGEAWTTNTARAQPRACLHFAFSGTADTLCGQRGRCARGVAAGHRRSLPHRSF